jgi:hypothetical protein
MVQQKQQQLAGGWTITGLQSSAETDSDVVSGGTSSNSVNVNVLGDGVVIAVASIGDAKPGTVTWVAGALEDEEPPIANSNTMRASFASQSGLSAETSRTITANSSASEEDFLVAAASYR